MEKYILNRETIENANRYIPIAKKQAYCSLIVKECIEKQIREEKESENDESLSLSCIWSENQIKKQLYILNVFLMEYLRIDLPEGVTTDVYDYYSSSHIFNQMERMKVIPEIKDAVFDILYDFKDFKKMLEIAIYNEKTRSNDSIGRIEEILKIIVNDPQKESEPTQEQK